MAVTTTSEATLLAQTAAMTASIVANQDVMCVGPDYYSRNYLKVPALKSSMLLGTTAVGDQTFSWPGLGTGEVVDQSFTRVFIDNAAQQYYSETALTTADAGSIMANQTTRIRTSARIWKTANGSTRSAQVPVDVAIGDWVQVYNGTKIVAGTVTALIGDIVAATAAATPTAASSNVPTNAGSSSVTAGGTNTSTTVSSVAASSNPANYDGSAARQPSETYTLTVTNVGANGTGIAGTWSTVTLSCVSASGTDPAQTGLVPTPAGQLSIGSRGARVQFSHGVSGNDWVLGDTFTVAVTQAYTIPTVAVAGTYTGSVADTYIVQITKGGASGTAQATVRTAGATDSGAALTITTGVAIALGTKGLTITFTGTKFFANDQWTDAVTPAAGGTVDGAGGAIRTLQISQSLEATSALTITNWVGSNIQIQLGLLGNIELPRNKIGYAPNLNFTQTSTGITIKGGAVVYATRTGVTPLVIQASQTGQVSYIYCVYRGLRTTLNGTVRSVSTEPEIAALLPGADDCDNGMAAAVRRLIADDGSKVVKFITVPTDDLAGYQSVKNLILDRPDWTTLVPLSLLSTVESDLITFTNTRSAAPYQMRTQIVRPLQVDRIVNVIKLRADGVSLSTATVVDDPLTTGTATDYTLVTDVSGQFITKAVLAGDQFRISYGSDGFGTETYTTATVASIASEQQLRLATSLAAPIGSASRYEIWRAPSAAAMVSQAGALAAAYNNPRVIGVFPDRAIRGGYTCDGAQVACSVAKIRSLAPPHAGLTTAAVTDWDSLPDAATLAGQYGTLNQYGLYSLRQLYDGQVVIEGNLTTAINDTNLKYDSVARNLDAILWKMQLAFEAFRGRSNIVEATLSKLESRFQAELATINNGSDVGNLGSMLVTGQLVGVRRHATLKDKAVVTFNLTLPAPLGSADFTVNLTV